MSCRLALSVRAASISMEIFVAECQKSIGTGLKTCWHVSVSEITVSSSESRHKIGRPGARAAAGTRIDLEETDMEPDLEVVQIRPGESFAAWSHGYPYRTVRWHFHPEYELHHVVATNGRYFVGDFIGEFEPGNLVLTGPNLPHNWVSDVPKDTIVPLRCRIIQFSEDFISGAMTALPELAVLAPVLESSRRGVLFSQETSREIAPLMDEADGRPGRAPHRAVHDDRRIAEPGERIADAGQRQLPARPVRLHVGRDQQGARLYPREPDAALRRGGSRGDRRPIDERVLARLPPAHRHVAWCNT